MTVGRNVSKRFFAIASQHRRCPCEYLTHAAELYDNVFAFIVWTANRCGRFARFFFDYFNFTNLYSVCIAYVCVNHFIDGAQKSFIIMNLLRGKN